jgi:hypothetical protein
MIRGEHSTPLKSERGYALVLVLGVMMVVTLGLFITEKTLSESLEISRRSAGRVQADWACYGAVHRAAWNPSDSLALYEYYGTRVQVTVHDPPLPLIEELMESAGPVQPASGETSEAVHMYCTVAASPTLGSTAEATWYFVLTESGRPKIWASWPGLERSQPYR